MLNHPSFRRTPKCGYFEREYVLSRKFPSFPAKRLIDVKETDEIKMTGEPFVISGDISGTGLRIPKGITLKEVAERIGEDLPVKVIEGHYYCQNNNNK